VLKAKPPRELVFLMAVGLLDLLSTVILYCLGYVQELNPLMRPLLEHSPITFTLVKLGTLALAFVGMQLYAHIDERFVRTAAKYGVIAYVALWTVCTTAGLLI
jgi:hypothetical protein